MSCAAKLLERLILSRLAWYLKANDFLPLELTGFRAHLAAQDSILDLTRDVEFKRERSCSTLAVFLDVGKAYDPMSATTVLSCLKDLGLSGRVIRFLRGFLKGRTFAVKLSATLSDPRPLKIGLPKGSVLTPLLFWVVMSRVAPVQMTDYIPVTTSIMQTISVFRLPRRILNN